VFCFCVFLGGGLCLLYEGMFYFVFGVVIVVGWLFWFVWFINNNILVSVGNVMLGVEELC